MTVSGENYLLSGGGGGVGGSLLKHFMYKNEWGFSVITF